MPERIRRLVRRVEEAELEFNERWADEAEARQEAEARADLALRRQLELDQLLAEQSEEAALILDEMQRCREQAQAERQLREAQDAKHARELTELAARWEWMLAGEMTLWQLIDFLSSYQVLTRICLFQMLVQIGFCMFLFDPVQVLSS